MNILKLKFELEDGTNKSISIKNVKEDVESDKIKAFAEYIISNKVINTGLHTMKKLVSAVLVNTNETTVSID